jgi:diguanylate cyclase (GGDEF)-like protein
VSDEQSHGSALTYYVMAVCIFAVGLLAWITRSAFYMGLHIALLPVIALSLVLVLGELRPIRISHGDGSVDEVTISSSFSLALVMTGPLLIAVLAQTVATLIDDLRQHKDVRRILFNIAQYVVTLTTSREVYTALTHRGLLEDATHLRAIDIPGGIVAAGVFFIANHVITTGAVALSLGEDPIRRLPVDLRYHLSTSGVLLALAPVLVIAVDFSVFSLPLLLMPIAAVHKSAKLAIQREAASLHDSLTGLPNRVMFRQNVSTMLVPGAEDSALMLIDLDYFKEINDTLGHHVGDLVITETAARLSVALADRALVARLGGDEFAVMVPATDLDEVASLSNTILVALSSPFVVEDMRVDMGASIGVALSPQHGSDVDTLLRRADVALYGAKEERNNVRIYSADDDQNTVRRLALLGDLRDAIADGQVTVRYQPKVDASTGRVVGVEALARWEHPVRGLVMPDEFIALAEHSGLMAKLTASVLDESLANLRMWRTIAPTLTIAVNVSPRQLSDRELPGLVAGALRRAGAPASALTLEVTETGVMGSSARVQAVLRELHELGLKLAIDDFGSGATSLSYLGRLPLSELKIDKQFVLGLEDTTNHAIVRSTIELGHNLGLQVVAEGVESLETWRTLLRLECDVIQGYYLAKPLLANDFTRFLGTPIRTPVSVSAVSAVSDVSAVPESACA